MIKGLMNFVERLFNQLSLGTIFTMVLIVALVAIARGKKPRIWWHIKRLFWLWVALALVGEFLSDEAQIILMGIAIICALVWVLEE